MASDGYRNFRLRGVPDAFQNRKKVRELVRTALQLSEDAKIAVHSLARNPLERYSMIATLTFENNVPKVLEGPQTEWMFALPGSDEDEAEQWGPQRLVFDTHFRGFTPLHRADDSECSTDLIAISGLAGHAFGSFKARGSSFMWLRDDLPSRLRQTRILIYGYDTKVANSKSFQNLNDLGSMFQLSVKRLQLGPSEHCQIHPTIFLGHSLGGLIIKEAITRMERSGEEEDEHFLGRIVAFMFFGVPHQGMATEHLFPMVGEQPNRSLIQSLNKHSAILQRYEEQFSEALDMEEPPRILSFYETEMSPTAKFNEDKQIWEPDETRLAVLVDRSSATNGCTFSCAMARNHSEMVKFTSEMDEMYHIVLALLLPLLNADRMISKSLSAKQRDCVQSLSFKQQESREAEVHDAENTCTWLLHHPRYRHWLLQSRGLLWIKGKPGAGKSVLMKYASERLRQEPSYSRELVASFFIHGRGIDLQKSVAGVFRALLNSLLPRFNDILSQATAVFEERESRYGSYREGRWQWTEKELEKFLLKVLKDTSAKRRIVIFIDALDEGENDTPTKLLTILKRFAEEIEQQNSYAKICFSSRHYPIPGEAHGVPKIVVEDENREDIRRVMERKLKDIKPNVERQRIADVILSKDNGVFQWAVLVADSAVKNYARGFGVKGIEREIKTLPAELDSLYARLLDEINADKSSKVQTIKLFRWVLFACRPLSVRELREALTTDPHMSYATISKLREHDYVEEAERFERRIIDMSKGLIQVNTRDVYEWIGPEDEGSDRQVEFIHQSVADYLLQYFLKPAESFDDDSQSSAGYGHFELSRSCLRYLTIREIRHASKLQRVEISVRYPLVAYATRYFFTHVRRAEDEQIDQSDLNRLLLWDDATKKDIALLWKEFDTERSYSPAGWPFQGGNLVHILAALGSISAFKAMLCEKSFPIDCTDSSNTTPLMIAIREGHHDIVQEMLYRHCKAMQTRAPGISDLDHFVDVNAVNDEDDTPMTLAVDSDEPEVIFKLIEAGASLKNFQPDFSPLFYSIEENNKRLLIELIKNGASLDGAVYFAVALMARRKDENVEELIQILLKAGANTQSHRELVHYATEQFYDSDNEEPVPIDSGSAFQIAADMRNFSILQLLLTHGPPEEMRDDLLNAMARRDLPLVEACLVHGSFPEEAEHDAFNVAVLSQNQPAVEFLLKFWSHTPEKVGGVFKRSIDENKVATVEMLLRCSLHIPEEEVRGAFKRAINRGNLLMVEPFFAYKANTGSLEPTIHATLMSLVVSGNEPLTETILDNTVEMDRSDSEIYDTLEAAVRSGKVSMVELLLNHRAIADGRELTDLYGALLVAVMMGDTSVASLLLPQGDMGSTSELGKWDHIAQVALRLKRPEILRSTLTVAIESGEKCVANVLLKWGAKVGSLESQELRKHLVFSVASGDVYMVELLLRHDVDIDAISEEDFIPTTPALASLLPFTLPTLVLQIYPWTKRNMGGFLSGALLYYAITRHYYRIFGLLLSQTASLDPKQNFLSNRTANTSKQILIELLAANHASPSGIYENLRRALREACLHNDISGVTALIRLIGIVHYGETLTLSPEYPTEKEIAEALVLAEGEYYRGVLSEIIEMATRRGRMMLVHFLSEYA